MGSFWRIISQLYVGVKGLFRYKGTVFWLILFPLMFYGLMVAIWGSPSYEPTPIGIVNLDKEEGMYNISNILIKAMNESKLFKVHFYNNESKLAYDLRHGKVSVGLVIPGEFSENLSSLSTAVIKMYYVNSSWSSYYKGVAEGFLYSFMDTYRNKTLEISLQFALQYVPPNMTQYIIKWYKFIDKPITFNTSSYTPEMLATPQGMRAFYAIGMIGVEILFAGLSVGVTAIIDMKRSGTIRILLSSPIKSWEAFISMTLEVLYGLSISAIVIWLFSLLIGAKYNLSIEKTLTIILLLLVGTLFTIGLGLVLAPLARSQEAGMAIVNGLAFPIMFLGGLVIPEFVLPSYLRSFADYYPLSQTIRAIRKMTIYNATPREAIMISMPSIIATIIIFIIGFLVYNRLLSIAAEE